MKYCIYCGAELVDEARFCGRCGKELPSNEPVFEEKEIQTKEHDAVEMSMYENDVEEIPEDESQFGEIKVPRYMNSEQESPNLTGYAEGNQYVEENIQENLYQEENDREDSSYGENSYGENSYGENTYNNQTYGEQTYENGYYADENMEAQYSENGYYAENSYEQGAYEQEIYEEDLYEEESYEEDSYEDESYEDDSEDEMDGTTGKRIALASAITVVAIILGLIGYLFVSGTLEEIFTGETVKPKNRMEKESQVVTQPSEQTVKNPVESTDSGNTDVETTDKETAKEEEPEPIAIESEYILQDSDSRYLTKADLEGLTAEKCRLARNEIYARHGRIFKDEALNQYFQSKSWYVGSVSADAFSDQVLNEYEIANRDLIVAYEKEKGFQ